MASSRSGRCPGDSLARPLAGGAHGQPLPADKVPASVRDAFKAKFPGLNKVEWKLKSDKNYEAEFKLKDVAVAAKFDDKGRWLETETAIEQSALPKEVLKVLLDGKGAVVSKSTERKKGP